MLFRSSVFLALAISRGLTMAIANPSQELLMRSGFAADLLMAKEEANLRYIEVSQRFDEENTQKEALTAQKMQAGPASGAERSSESSAKVLTGLLADIHTDVVKGYGKRIAGHVQEALSSGIEASDILNEALIPAINLVGDYFARQKYFLPQLMLSADAMRKAVDDLEPVLKQNRSDVSGPVVVIATVKGDVHDIGKNLVAMMMSNYGFDVHDLGKDVDKTTIIDAALEYNAQIICLSALMTTTMQYMKEVVELANEKCPEAKVIIGGAATTQSYADEIGAAGYSEDAVGAVALVKRLLKLE